MEEKQFKIEQFDWDKWNIEKIRQKHKVEPQECEEVFFNEPLVVLSNDVHSLAEPRYHALGRTDAGRLLFIVFTIRHGNIRVISSRSMNKKERRIYHEKTKKDSQIQE